MTGSAAMLTVPISALPADEVARLQSLAAQSGGSQPNAKLPVWAREHLNAIPAVDRSVPAHDRLPWIATALGLTRPGVGLDLAEVRRREDLLDLILVNGEVITL